jgi:NTE family protein
LNIGGIKLEIDLVLSGSGIRFLAFIGGYKALEEEGISIARLAGTSGGAIVASGIACGMTSSDFIDLVMATDTSKLKDFSIFELLFSFGLYRGERIRKLVDTASGSKTFSQVNRDLRIIATDFSRRAKMIFSPEITPDVKISDAVRFSIGIPLMFGYRKWNNAYMVDGLVSSNYELDMFDDNERPTVGFRIGSKIISPDIPLKITAFNIFEYILMCIDTLIVSVEQEHIEDADWARSIYMDVSKWNATNFNLSQQDKQDMINIGYETVKANIYSILQQ